MPRVSRFFGYNKQEVDRYIDQISNQYEADYNKLITELRNIEEENDLLKKDIEELTSKSENVKELELLELSLERIEAIYEYLKRYQDEDFYNIFSEELSIREKLKEDINNIEESIQETKDNIKKELEHVNKIIKSSNFSLVTTGHSATGKNSNSSDKDSTGNDNEESSIRLMTKPIAADGTPLFDEWDKKKESPARQKQTKNEEKPAPIFELTFWGKTEPEDTISEKFRVPEDKVPEDKVPEDKVPEDKVTKDIVTKDTETTQEKYQDDINDLHNLDFSVEKEIAATWQKSEGNSVTENKETVLDHDLKEKIDLVRYKYVIGKLAGEDLTDNSGGLIISKHEEITADVIEAAQRESKLSELIINMVVQGMDE